MRWEQLSVLIRHALNEVHSSSLTSVGDLFDFTNVLAKAVGGAVTVEDAGGQVHAYSTLREDELDARRREAILGRQVPEPYLEAPEGQGGVFEAPPRKSHDVIELEPHERFGLRRRLAIARAESELLDGM